MHRQKTKLKEKNPMSNEIKVSTNCLPPTEISEIAIVYGAAALADNAFLDISRWVRNITIGGELKSGTKMMQRAMNMAIDRMTTMASGIGADGIYGVIFGTPEVANEACEVFAVGTAYREGAK